MPRDTRQHDLNIEVKLSDRVKPLVRSAAQPQPALTADRVFSIEDRAGDVHVEQELILADLVARTPDSEPAAKAEYYFQLGAVYVKRQRHWQGRSGAALARSMANEYLLKALKTYKALTDNDAFQNYPKMETALFYYAYMLQVGGYLEQARGIYDRLLKSFPASKYAPEVHLALGDYHFQIGQLDEAAARYLAASRRYPSPGLYWYAMYRLGWIALTKQRFQDALETFRKVIQWLPSDPRDEILGLAAKKGFARAYALLGKTDKASLAFRYLAPRNVLEMLEFVAEAYLEYGESGKAILVYRELMAKAPSHRNMCLWQYHIAHATLSLSGAQSADRIKEIENLAGMYRTLRARKTLPAAEAQDCHDNAAAMSGELARAYHSESAKTKNPEMMASAEKLYRIYLQTFPDAEDFADTEYFYAELLWWRAENEKNARLQTALWEDAAVAFTDVVNHGKVEPRRMKESAYAAVLGWRNALNVDPRIRQVVDIDSPTDRDAQPWPIPAREQKMLAAFEIYINSITDPRDDDLVAMKFIKASTYRRYNHYDEAIPIFLDILEHHKQHETAEFAANLLLEIYNNQQRYDDMVALVDKLAADTTFLDGKGDLRDAIARRRLQGMRRIADRQQVEARASNDIAKFVACGQTYMDIYNRSPDVADADDVLYSAGACFESGKSLGAAITAYSLLEKHFPTSRHAGPAVLRTAKLFASIASYDRAADKLEQYARKFAGMNDASDAIMNALYYREGLGEDDRAFATASHFITMFEAVKPEQAASVMFSLTRIYERRDDTSAVIKHLREYIQRFGAKGGADRAIIANAKLGEALWHQSCPVPELYGACVRVVPERVRGEPKPGMRRNGLERPSQCGSRSKARLTVIKRDDLKVKEALAAFSAAIRAYERSQGKTGGDQREVRHHYALARLAEADREFEAYLGLPFPVNDFASVGAELALALHEPQLAGNAGQSPGRSSAMKRFMAWNGEKETIARAVRGRYNAVAGIQDAPTTLAAMARLGQIDQSFADQLLTADIPINTRNGDFVDKSLTEYCRWLAGWTDRAETEAADAYRRCLARSDDLGWFDESSLLCERELAQLRPGEVSTPTELHGAAEQTRSVTDIERAEIELN